MIEKSKIEKILYKLEDHLKSTDFNGYDPHDALNSPILRTLTFGSRFFGIIYLQLIKKCPINLRPILLVKQGVNPKGLGLLISAYVLKYKFYNNDKYLKQAKQFADWLITNYSKGYSGKCWGYNFDCPNRNSYSFSLRGSCSVAYISLVVVLFHRKSPSGNS